MKDAVARGLSAPDLCDERTVSLFTARLVVGELSVAALYDIRIDLSGLDVWEKSEYRRPPQALVEASESRFKRFLEFVGPHRTDGLWLETIASAHFLASVHGERDKDVIFQKIKTKQPRVTRRQFDACWSESGCDTWTLARIAGHSSIAISARYVHPSHDSVLAAVDRLGGHKIGHSEMG
jgi:hypothetical protein